MAKTKEKETEQLVVTGIITGTSDKQTDKFVVEFPRKSIYFVPSSDDETEKLKKFGLTLYTPEESDEQSFFIIKASEKITLYDEANERQEYQTLNSSLGSKNFNTDGEVVKIALIKGEKATNTYFRVYAILTNGTDVITEVVKENPFLNL